METLGRRRVRGKERRSGWKADVLRSTARLGNASGLSGSQTFLCTSVTLSKSNMLLGPAPGVSDVRNLG